MSDTDKELQNEVSFQRIHRQALRIVKEQEAAERARRPVLVFDGEESFTPPEYLIDGLLPIDGAGMLFGESDVGKTFVAVSMSVAIAGGRDWLGHRVKPGTVLFLEAEGGRSFALRKHAAKGAAGLGDKRMLEAFPFVTSYESLAFGPDTDITQAIASATFLRTAIEARGLPPVRLVVADTLTQHLAGDGNDNTEMSAFMRAFRAFVKAMSADPVFGLVIHHPGHSEKSRGRGAYALEADLDTVLHLEGSREALTLTCKRQRDSDRCAPIHLQLERRDLTSDGEPMLDRHGRPVTSLVVVSGGGVEAQVYVDPTRVAILRALSEATEPVSPRALVGMVCALLPKNVSRAKVERWLYRLQDDGLVQSAPGRQANTLVWSLKAVEVEL